MYVSCLLYKNESSPLEWHHLPTKFHQNLPIGSKDIRRFFISKASNAFKSFSLHSYITAFLSFLPYSMVHALVAIVISAKNGMRYKHENATMLRKESKPSVEQGSLHNFEPQQFFSLLSKK
jgi:hypothetical protein